MCGCFCHRVAWLCAHFYMSVKFVLGSKQGISLVDLDLIYQSPYEHKRKPLQRKEKMLTVFVANCVHTVQVIHLSVALAT